MSTIGGLVRRATLQASPLARQYAEGNMIARVRVTRTAKASFDRATGGSAKGSTQVIWDGIGRVHRVSAGPTMDLGDEPQYFSTATISIPLDSEQPQINDRVQVLSHPDPNIVGRIYKVDGVAAGGQIPVCHEMSCTGVQASPSTS